MKINMPFIRIVTACLSLLLWLPNASSAVHVNSDGGRVSLAGHLEFLFDDPGKKTLTDVIADSPSFKRLPGFLNRGYTNSTSWLRVDIHNAGQDVLSQVLMLSPPTLDEVDVYVQQGNDANSPVDYRHFALGDHTPMADKPLPYTNMALPLEIEPGGVQRVYLRVRSQGSQSLHAEIMSPFAALASNLRHTAMQSAHLAIAAALATINFLIFMRLRDKVNALYGSYLLTLALGDLGIENMIGLFWPDKAHHLADWMTGIGTGLGFTFISLFAIAAMNTRLHHRWVYRYLSVIAILGVAAFLASGSEWYGALTQILMINGPLVTILLVWLPWQMIKRGDVAIGRLILLAFAVSAGGAAITFLRLLGLLPLNNLTLHALQASSIVHMILMMRSLSERVLVAEAAAVQAASNSEKNAIQLATQMTEDIIQSKIQIQDSLDRERRMREEQARFIDSISHEYRTPLSILRTHLDVLDARQLIDGKRLATMSSAVQRLQDIFDNALQAHRIGRPPDPKMEELDFVRLLNEVVNEFQLSFPDCPLQCQTNGSAALITGDEGLLKTALRNIFDNARKYRFPANPDNAVICRLSIEPSRVILLVDNASNPTLPLNRSALFERYVRGATRSTTSGMGLGLYLVRRILHDHHGEVEIVDTAPSRFEIKMVLPRRKA